MKKRIVCIISFILFLVTVILITNDNNLTLPDLTGLSRKQAEELLKLLDITPTLEGSGYVVEQSVPAGTKIEKGMSLTLKLAKKF